MTPTEFVAGLAEVMGVEKTELATVDRALAKRGFRTLARGRSRPDITLQEGLQIAFAWAGAKHVTTAADEVERLQRFFLVTVVQGGLFEGGEETVKADKYFREVFGADPRDLNGMGFLDVLAIAARSLGTGKVPEKSMQVIITKGGMVGLSYQRDQKRPQLRFAEGGKFEFRQQPNVRVTFEISGAVLKWIFDVTEGA
ncbi:hypothetical protein HMH01_13025 [Halovulum dunhuangense]|uniref:Uncharacterized protein n=1 Tax=Halovulum dunhuangense TaxID=1505036 RepID=A0A849L5A2_9RHOB|nr:hypothetical protein [Halovulum dunhuangense]NNU81360.1 hypothetical protein [Halovulum dunhuangense]